VNNVEDHCEKAVVRKIHPNICSQTLINSK